MSDKTPKISPVDGWAVARLGVIPGTFELSERACLDALENRYGCSWEKLVLEGYRCIPVRIVPREEE